MEFSCDVPGLDLFWNPVMQDLAHTSGFLTEPNPVPDQWPKPEPIAEEDQIVVPGEGKDNFPETEAAASEDLSPPVLEDGVMRVRDVITRKVRTTKVDLSIRSVARTICKKKIGGLPVVDDGNHLVGIISEKDILKAMLPGYTEYLEDPIQAMDFRAMEQSYGNVLRKKVGELMNKTVGSSPNGVGRLS